MNSKHRFLMAVIISALLTISIVAAVNARSNLPRSSINQAAATQKSDRILRPSVRQAVRHDTSRPLRDLPSRQPLINSAQPQALPFFPLPRSQSAHQTNRAGVDPLLADQSTLPQPLPASPLTVLNNFDGLYNFWGYYPPDTQGDIGFDPTTGKKYYIQWVNVQYAIWDVTLTPTVILTQTDGNMLWQGFGGECETQNDGDPITLFDPISHRWLMSQFAVPAGGPYYQCIAISTSADPTGAWHRYAYRWQDSNLVDTFNDYGKFGVWPDGFYFSANQFSSAPEAGLAANHPASPQAVTSYKGAGVAVFERDKMLNGQDARMIYFDLNPIDPTLGGMLPSHLAGIFLPPPGSPNYFAEVDDSAFGSSVSVITDSLRIWKFHTDWTTPDNSTFGVNGAANYTLTVAAYDSLPCVMAGTLCIPQPDPVHRLDGVADRLMYRLTYRNFGDHEALVVNHTVLADGTDRAGVRWYEVRNPNGAADIYQQGTFAPNDGLYRWMGSAAMDHNGNLALGYSVANSVTYPSIRATGRLASDPLGSMSQAETIIVTGTGSQTGTAGRWGDYSTLSIDPVDDCTFWYSQEYVKVTGPANWLGRVASFKFPSCNLGLGGLTGKITDSATTNPISNVLITASLGPTYSVSTLSDVSGIYALSVISGSYRLLAATYGFLPATLNGILITSTVMTTQNIMLTPAPLHVVSGTIRDATAGWPLYARLQITGNPIDPPSPLNDVWTDPVSGFYSISLAEGISYTFKATAWVTGYLPTNSTIKLTKDATQNISVSADPATCLAPGYQYTSTGLVQNFETWPPAGWSIVDNIPGPSLVWNLDSFYTDTNYTGGSGHAADVNSDHNNGTPYDTELRSPIINLAILPPMQLRYKLNYQDFSLGKDAFDVDISTNSGSSWTNLRHFTSNSGAHYSLPGATDSISLAAYASQTNVILRWRYYSLEAMPWDWYAQIDEVNLVSCTPQAGGLVVGNSYSGTLAYPLANVQVANEIGNSTGTTTTIDPQVDDSFYTLFSLAGSGVFTATKAQYQALVTTTHVIMSNTVRLDLYLRAAEIEKVYLPLTLKNF